MCLSVATPKSCFDLALQFYDGQLFIASGGMVRIYRSFRKLVVSSQKILRRSFTALVTFYKQSKNRNLPNIQTELRTTALTTPSTSLISLAPMSPIVVCFVGNAVVGIKIFNVILLFRHRASVLVSSRYHFGWRAGFHKILHRFLIHY